jgi:very-short-patch-repair endonuclease
MSDDAASGPLSRVRERVRVRARALRQRHTPAQDAMWFRLRNRQFMGLKFRREHPIAGYVADFACIEIGLVVELDGGQHAEPDAAAHDAQRQAVMLEQGFHTLRFWNHEVLTAMDAVLEKLRLEIDRLSLTPTLSRKRERVQDPESP